MNENQEKNSVMSFIGRRIFDGGVRECTLIPVFFPFEFECFFDDETEQHLFKIVCGAVFESRRGDDADLYGLLRRCR